MKIILANEDFSVTFSFFKIYKSLLKFDKSPLFQQYNVKCNNTNDNYLLLTNPYLRKDEEEKSPIPYK